VPAGGLARRVRRGSRAQQYLAAGAVDEFELHIVPVPLGAGERLLENVCHLMLEQVRVIEAPGVTHVKYRRAPTNDRISSG
jgi:dihydrofolate reductase